MKQTAGKTQHTPGPWSVRREQIADAEGSVIARVTDNESHGYDCPTPAVARMNAEVLAAAPDMLAMLKALRRTVASMGGDLEVTAPESINANTYSDELRRIEALIAKAEGRS